MRLLMAAEITQIAGANHCIAQEILDTAAQYPFYAAGLGGIIGAVYGILDHNQIGILRTNGLTLESNFPTHFGMSIALSWGGGTLVGMVVGTYNAGVKHLPAQCG